MGMKASMKQLGSSGRSTKRDLVAVSKGDDILIAVFSAGRSPPSWRARALLIDSWSAGRACAKDAAIKTKLVRRSILA